MKRAFADLDLEPELFASAMARAAHTEDVPDIEFDVEPREKKRVHINLQKAKEQRDREQRLTKLKMDRATGRVVFESDEYLAYIRGEPVPPEVAPRRRRISSKMDFFLELTRSKVTPEELAAARERYRQRQGQTGSDRVSRQSQQTGSADRVSNKTG